MIGRRRRARRCGHGEHGGQHPRRHLLPGPVVAAGAPAAAATRSDAGGALDADVGPAGPALADDAPVEVGVEQVGEATLQPGGLDVGLDLVVEGPGLLGRHDQRAGVERHPPQVAREVDDLGARRLRHLDVAGLGHPGELGDRRRPGRSTCSSTCEQIDVVEDLVGERHVGGVGVEQRPVDARRRRARCAGRRARRRRSDRAARRRASAACRRCRHRAPGRRGRRGWRCVAGGTTAARRRHAHRRCTGGTGAPGHPGSC